MLKYDIYIYLKKDCLIAGIKNYKGMIFLESDDSLNYLGLEERISLFVKRIIEVTGGRISSVAFLIDDSNIVFREFEIPILKKEGLDIAVEWKMKEFLNDDIEYFIDYMVLSKLSNEEKKVYNIAGYGIPRFVPDMLTSIMKGYGIRIRLIDSAHNCLVRYFLRELRKNSFSNTLCLVYLNNKNPRISFIKRGRVVKQVGFDNVKDVDVIVKVLLEVGANEKLSLFLVPDGEICEKELDLFKSDLIKRTETIDREFCGFDFNVDQGMIMGLSFRRGMFWVK